MDKEKRCKNCFWFNSKIHPEFDVWNEHETIVLEEYGGCKNETFSYLNVDSFDNKEKIKQKVKGKLFLYEDSENLRADIHVHEDFCCVGFKKWEKDNG